MVIYCRYSKKKNWVPKYFYKIGKCLSSLFGDAPFPLSKFRDCKKLYNIKEIVDTLHE